MLSIAIVDDSSIFINILKTKINSYFSNANIQIDIQTFLSTEKFIDSFDKPLKFNYIFLDFEMGQVNGYDCGKQLRKVCTNFKLIYVTSYDETIYQCVENDIFGFVRKSNFDIEINSCLERLLLYYNSTFIQYNFKCAEGYISLFSNEILYFEFSNRNIYIYTTINTYRITEKITLSEIYNTFKDFDYIYICKGIIANLLNVKSINKDELTLTNNHTLKIAKRRVQDVTYAYYSRLRR